jgi:hypothetical protein
MLADWDVSVSELAIGKSLVSHFREQANFARNVILDGFLPTYCDH